MKSSKALLISAAIIVVIFLVGYFVVPIFMSQKYDVESPKSIKETATTMIATTSEPKKAAHIKTPETVKGIYMTSWIASSKKLRDPVVNVIDTTEANAIVIDIKDYSGKVSFELNDPDLKALNVSEHRIPDIDSFIEELHQKGIYVIGRVAVFQDPYLSIEKPEMAVKRKDNGEVWKDNKGISWIDAGSEEYWKYIVALSKESYARGFDEIQFDYIRFPSDGDMENITYPFSEGKKKSDVLASFFKYLYDNLSPAGIPISADLFGMTTTVNTDLGIGQRLEDAFSYMDFVSPMVYPSHYPPTWDGFQNPAEHPYEVIRDSMQGAIDKVNALKSATSTPADIRSRVGVKQLRPWIQDFNLGADYGPTEVKAELQSAHDLGLDSWLIWNPSNKYTVGALDK